MKAFLQISMYSCFLLNASKISPINCVFYSKMIVFLLRRTTSTHDLTETINLIEPRWKENLFSISIEICNVVFLIFRLFAMSKIHIFIVLAIESLEYMFHGQKMLNLKCLLALLIISFIIASQDNRYEYNMFTSLQWSGIFVSIVGTCLNGLSKIIVMKYKSIPLRFELIFPIISLFYYSQYPQKLLPNVYDLIIIIALSFKTENKNICFNRLKFIPLQTQLFIFFYVIENIWHRSWPTLLQTIEVISIIILIEELYREQQNDQEINIDEFHRVNNGVHI